ncbi:diacylglycerol/lipid kinase family protein [Microlunatus soli]|uniref:Lipid kinase, YegS/Rv2252/BmrU family n=1 Tax=Microlunatus soli TaxID=630515 RepID=A0A1H1XFE4_9ACTN|nr:diacylglycerol kinase family protein [Microlunatus soli]SDT07860.1 lipid kinase, YegS/Rv2252/BmrU family [Microlunatus soli]
MTEPTSGDGTQRRVAVIYNPIKIGDGLREMINTRAADSGWAEPLWLETTEDDPGRRMAADARAADVDLVIAAGGDGTVRAAVGGLADSGIPLGVVPEGTGNLLARNLGIPLQEQAAIEVAFEGTERSLDVVAITTDDAPETDRFAVMAGIGLDAAIMSNTDSNLKDKVGSLAYVVAATQQLQRRPRQMRVTVDDHPALERKAKICLVGNVGAIQGDVELISGAEPDDGLLDVLVASPKRIRHWIALASRLITGKQRAEDRIDQLTGRRVVVELTEPDEYQLDGDTIGSCRRLVAEIEPGALMIRVPEPSGTTTSGTA